MKILSVVGARPNFMKIAPFVRAIDQYNRSCSSRPIEHILLHTGQHYDVRMSDAFFRELGIPDPDINLGIGSGSHAEQLGHTMIEFEKYLVQITPDWVVVVGDINATLACSVIAKRLNIKVCHIEAGLRSGDMSMPEEVNRLVTDRLADLLLTPDRISSQNLREEGTTESRILFVGNIMIDTLEDNRTSASALSVTGIVSDNLLEGQTFKEPRSNGQQTAVFSGYAVATLHRPSNVDREEVLGPLLDFLSAEVAAAMPVIWPIHPRAQKMLQSFGRWEKALACKNLFLLHPVGYHEMLRLNMSATLMLTDSGGLQEECCVLGTPCLTLRSHTERPVTLREHGGTGVLTGSHIPRIREEYRLIKNAATRLPGGPGSDSILRVPVRPELWDGQTAMRCVQAIVTCTGFTGHKKHGLHDEN